MPMRQGIQTLRIRSRSCRPCPESWRVQRVRRKSRYTPPADAAMPITASSPAAPAGMPPARGGVWLAVVVVLTVARIGVSVGGTARTVGAVAATTAGGCCGAGVGGVGVVAGVNVRACATDARAGAEDGDTVGTALLAGATVGVP